MGQIIIERGFWQKYRDVMPIGAGALYLMQMFSILSFSVLYSTLILYTTKSLHMSDIVATSITGSFLALNYFLHLIGGYIGGRYLSYRSLFVISMLCEVIGCAFIAIPNVSFLFWGLALFLTGCGLNITCINCLLTQLFKPDDKNREASFLWNYSGQNIGFFVGFIIAGYFDLHQAYQKLFLLSALGNIAAIVITLCNWNTLRDRGTRFVDLTKAKQVSARLIGIGAAIAVIFALRNILQSTAFCNQLILVVTIIMFWLVILLAFKQPVRMERNKILAYSILALGAIIFWTLILIGPMGLNLFIERNVDRHFLNVMLAPQWVLNMSNFVTIIGAPILSVVFTRLRSRGINITIPLQFSVGLLLIGISFVILPIGIHFANAQGYSNVNWVLASYTVQSVGDLFVSPIGYALVGQLAPPNLRGMMMGTWLMFGGVTGVLADYFSKMALGGTDSVNPLITNLSYSQTFFNVGASAIIAGMVLLICTPIIAKMTQERKSLSERIA